MPTSTLANTLRVFAGCITGLVVALVLVVAVELVSAVVHPLPADFGGTQAEMCAHVARYPQWVLALVVPAWGLTAFAGTWTAQRVASGDYASPLGRGREISSGRGNPAALIVGLLLTAAVLSNVSMLPYPIWFKIASPIAVIAAVIAAIRTRRRSAAVK